MSLEMKSAQQRFSRLLEASETTRGMYVRVHGKHLIAGRNETFQPGGAPERSDRVRLTRFHGSSYRLGVKRHTGRWEETSFIGSMEEMVQMMHLLMQHLLAPWGDV